jgi:hypothetical protein
VPTNSNPADRPPQPQNKSTTSIEPEPGFRGAKKSLTIDSLASMPSLRDHLRKSAGPLTTSTSEISGDLLAEFNTDPIDRAGALICV